MRLIPMGLPFVLCLVAGPSTLDGQQAPPAASQKPAQSSIAKPSTAPATHTAASRHVAHKRHGKAIAHRRKKRPEYRPEYSENSVEVINGEATKKVVFQNDQAPTATRGKKLARGMKSAPAPMKVEVVNGSATDTQYFYGNGPDSETAQNQPVVIGIQSSDTRVAGGNKRPVVTSVTSSGVQGGKSVAGGGQPVTRQVSPRPKRPVYEPDAH